MNSVLNSPELERRGAVECEANLLKTRVVKNVLRMHNTTLSGTALALTLILHVGCGSNAANVQGIVTINGQKADSGYVTFQLRDPDKPAFCAHYHIENGLYDSKSSDRPLPIGEYEVRAAVTQRTGRQIPLPGAPDGQMQDELIVISSEEFSGPRTPLNCEVHSGVVTYDIEVPIAKASNSITKVDQQ